MTTKMTEFVTKNPGSDHGLGSHESCPHLGILPPAIVSSERLLDLDGCCPHLQEPSSVIPASDTSLKNQNLPCENSIPLLLQEQVMGILQEDLGSAQLIVSFAQHLLTNLGCCLPTLHLVGRRTATDQVPVPLHKLLEGVSDGISCPPDSDGLHHTGVSQLATAQLSVKHLKVKFLYKTLAIIRNF